MRKLEAILWAVFLAALLAIPSGRVGFAQEGNLKANLDLPFEAAGEDEEEEAAPETIIFYGQQYEADFFCFVADRSGSMNINGRWQKLQNEVAKTITGFSERVQFGIVFIANQLTKFPASGQPAEANPAQKEAAISMVMSTQTDRGSCYMEGLIEGLCIAARSTSKRKVIICLGDGEVACNGADGVTLVQQTLSAVKARNVMGTKINTIGIGVAYGEPFMKTLAQQNNGQYKREE